MNYSNFDSLRKPTPAQTRSGVQPRSNASHPLLRRPSPYSGFGQPDTMDAPVKRYHWGPHEQLPRSLLYQNRPASAHSSVPITAMHWQRGLGDQGDIPSAADIVSGNIPEFSPAVQQQIELQGYNPPQLRGQQTANQNMLEMRRKQVVQGRMNALHALPQMGDPSGQSQMSVPVSTPLSQQREFGANVSRAPTTTPDGYYDTSDLALRQRHLKGVERHPGMDPSTFGNYSVDGPRGALSNIPDAYNRRSGGVQLTPSKQGGGEGVQIQGSPHWTGEQNAGRMYLDDRKALQRARSNEEFDALLEKTIDPQQRALIEQRRKYNVRDTGVREQRMNERRANRLRSRYGNRFADQIPVGATRTPAPEQASDSLLDRLMPVGEGAAMPPILSAIGIGPDSSLHEINSAIERVMSSPEEYRLTPADLETLRNWMASRRIQGDDMESWGGDDTDEIRKHLPGSVSDERPKYRPWKIIQLGPVGIPYVNPF